MRQSVRNMRAEYKQWYEEAASTGVCIASVLIATALLTVVASSFGVKSPTTGVILLLFLGRPLVKLVTISWFFIGKLLQKTTLLEGEVPQN